MSENKTPIKFDPELCLKCETTSCLMNCQYIDFADRAEARAEKLKINDGKDSRVLHECLTCYACQEYCPFGNNPFFLIVDRQEEQRDPARAKAHCDRAASNDGI